MKAIVIFILYFMSLTACFGFCTFLMYQGVKGWGWLLFVALLIFGNMHVKVE